MSDGVPPGMSFPQKVHTEDEDFVIELDENHMAGPHDGFMDPQSRCKRRKRCGQCGPCQVKENCMKCHFCIRKDVLKQTCIYRKCVYLRSKPKPYSRSHQSPQGRASPREVLQASPVVKSPPNAQAHAGMPFPDAGVLMPEPRPENHPFFPAQLPQQSSAAAQQNNGYMSPPNPVMDTRTPSLPNHTAATNMNMQMGASPHMQNNATSPPLHKVQDASSPVVPQPVNSPAAALPGIPPISSCSSISPHVSSIPHMGPSVPSVFSPPTLSSSSLANIPSIPALPSMPSERTVNEFRPPDQFSLTPHHPHPHYPPVHPHPHMAPRETGLIMDPSRVPHMNFNPSSHMETFGRGPNDSSCMYHPGLPYSVPGHYQPSGPSFIPGAAEMNPFRSNFLNSFPPGYSYPPDRYREGFGSLPFTRLGMPSSAAFSQYPGQGYGIGNSFSQQYYNSQHGCPKNGSRPPVSPSTDDVKVLQEGYKNEYDENNVKSSVFDDMCRPHSKGSDLCSPKAELESPRVRKNSGKKSSDNLATYPDYFHPKSNLGMFSPRMDHLRVWSEFYLSKAFGPQSGIPSPSQTFKSPVKTENMASPNFKSPLWEPWRMSPWYSPRRDDVRSRTSTSTQSSDFECEVISIDDHQMNALIRSDGCNSIEIELDNNSLCSSVDSSPRKCPSSSVSTENPSPMKGNYFQPIDKLQITEPRSLFSQWDEHGNKLSVSRDNRTGCNNSLIKIAHQNDKRNWHDISSKENSVKRSKIFIEGSVCIRQDLGDEGIMQLELPGHKVTIEDAVLSEELESQCSNMEELKEFIKSNSSVQAEKDTVLA